MGGTPDACGHLRHDLLRRHSGIGSAAIERADQVGRHAGSQQPVANHGETEYREVGTHRVGGERIGHGVPQVGEPHEPQRAFVETPQHQALTVADRRKRRRRIAPDGATIGGAAGRHATVDGAEPAKRVQRSVAAFHHAGVNAGDRRSTAAGCERSTDRGRQDVRGTAR